jgi:hypothetical protein
VQRAEEEPGGSHLKREVSMYQNKRAVLTRGVTWTGEDATGMHQEIFPAGAEVEVLQEEYNAGKGTILNLRPGAPPHEWRQMYVDRDEYAELTD